MFYNGKDEFPEWWCIKPSNKEEKEQIENFFISKGGKMDGLYIIDNGYGYYCFTKTLQYFALLPSGTLITFFQFKKHILNEDITPDVLFFDTNTNIEIIEGQEYWIASSDISSPHNVIATKGVKFNEKAFWYHKKEDAEQYISLYKKQFSKKFIIDIIEQYNFKDVYDLREFIEKL